MNDGWLTLVLMDGGDTVEEGPYRKVVFVIRPFGPNLAGSRRKQGEAEAAIPILQAAMDGPDARMPGKRKASRDEIDFWPNDGT